MGFFQSAKEKTSKAASATKRAALKTKLKAEIGLENSRIKDVKKEFGQEVWNFMETGDWESAKTVFEAAHDRVKAHECEIRGYECEIRGIEAESQ